MTSPTQRMVCLETCLRASSKSNIYCLVRSALPASWQGACCATPRSRGATDDSTPRISPERAGGRRAGNNRMALPITVGAVEITAHVTFHGVFERSEAGVVSGAVQIADLG